MLQIRRLSVAVALIVGLVATGYLFVAQTRAAQRQSTQAEQQVWRQKREDRNRLEEKAEAAWKIDHNYAQAEALFHQSEQLYGSTDWNQLCLAQLLDEQGRTKEALTYYRKLVNNPSASSTLKRPSVLIRYAELCEKYGIRSEAMAGYGQAITTAGLDHLGVKVPVDGMSLVQRKSMLKIVAMAHSPGGLSGNVKELDALVKNQRIAAGYLFLADGYINLGRAEEAHAALLQAQSRGTNSVRMAAQEMHQSFMELPAATYRQKYDTTAATNSLQ